MKARLSFAGWKEVLLLDHAGRKADARMGMVVMAVATIIPISATQALAQDVVKISPETHVVILENAQVRVLSVRVKPGEKVAMHSHPRNVVYYLSGATLRLTRPDGTVEDRAVMEGMAVWSDGTVHAAENVGTTELREVQVELKTSPNKPVP